MSKLANFCISARDDKLQAFHDLLPGEISSQTAISVAGVIVHQIEGLMNSVYKVPWITRAWPEERNMNTYSIHIHPMILYSRDPIELIAELLLIPRWCSKLEIKFDSIIISYQQELHPWLVILCVENGANRRIHILYAINNKDEKYFL